VIVFRSSSIYGPIAIGLLVGRRTQCRGHERESEAKMYDAVAKRRIQRCPQDAGGDTPQWAILEHKRRLACCF
jgi:hypothetical protein